MHLIPIQFSSDFLKKTSVAVTIRCSYSDFFFFFFPVRGFFHQIFLSEKLNSFSLYILSSGLTPSISLQECF